MKDYLGKLLILLVTTLCLTYGFFWLSEDILWENAHRTLETDSYKIDAYALTRNYYRALCNSSRTQFCQTQLIENNVTTFSVPGHKQKNTFLNPFIKTKKVAFPIFGANVFLKITIYPNYKNLFKLFTFALFLQIPFILLLLYLKKRNDFLKNIKITELSKRLAHDINGPVTTLKYLLHDEKLETTEKNILIEHTIERIEGIAQSLVNSKHRPLNVLTKFDLVKTIQIINKEKKLESPSNIIFSSQVVGTVYQIKFNKNELSRILSNLYTNSIEANANEISTIIHFKAELITIIIKDNGCGIESEKLSIIGTKEISSSKEYGNGIGFFHARKILKTLNSEIEITSEGLNKGTTVTLTIPQKTESITLNSPAEKIDAFLIDDEKIIRLIWGKHYQKNSLNLKVFQIPNDAIAFFNSHKSYTHIPIFIDFNISENVNGRDLAIELNEMGYSNLHLITGLDLNSESVKSLKKENVFKTINNKTPQILLPSK